MKGRVAPHGRRSRLFTLRLTVLLLGLLAAGAWALRQQRTRAFRTDWERSVVVEVVLAAQGPVPDAAVERWRTGLVALEEWMAAESARYRRSAVPPVQFSLQGPVVIQELPTLELPEGGFARLKGSWEVSRQLSAIEALLPPGRPRSDARLFVLLEDQPSAEWSVEGIGARGGNVGAVRAHAQDDELTLSLTAVAHELFHCLGAVDKYDERGHAQSPEGLAEPERPLPGRYAEVMVGEVPVSLSEGRLPTSLGEVRVGPATAREIRWVR